MIKNLIEKLNSVLKFSKENFKSSNIKGTDTAVEYAENAEGIDVMVASSNGSETAPNGVIELDNGDSFEVIDGKIAKVITTEKADEAKDEKTEELTDEKKEDKAEDEKVEIIIADAKEDEAKEDEAKEDDSKDEKAKALEDEIEKLKEELKALKGEFSAIPTKADLENFKTEFLKELKNTPAPEAFTKGTEVTEKETKWNGFRK